jgi:hypothetical protein
MGDLHGEMLLASVGVDGIKIDDIINVIIIGFAIVLLAKMRLKRFAIFTLSMWLRRIRS